MYQFKKSIFKIRKQVIDNKYPITGAIAGLSIFLLAVGQLDLLCAYYVWRDLHIREIFSLPIIGPIYMQSGEFYNWMMWMKGLGFILFGYSLANLKKRIHK